MGVEGNFNLATISQSMADANDEIPDKLRATFSAGLTSELGISQAFKIIAAILYSSKGLSVSLNDVYDLSGLDIRGFDKIVINYLEVPINLVYTKGIFQILGGPY